VRLYSCDKAARTPRRWTVVSEVKGTLGRFQAPGADDIKVSYELDQSRNVSASLQAVLREAALGPF